MNYKFHVKILLLFIICIIFQGCSYPDDIPNPLDLKNFKLEKLKFGKTTLKEFTNQTGCQINRQIGDTSIIKTDSAYPDLYSGIRIGFRNNKLDWIEFALNRNFAMTDVVNIYGKPRDINTSYNKLFNYYDYDFFNISTDKQNTLAKNITFFEIPQKLPEPIHIINDIPDWDQLQNGDFMNLKPGYSLEVDFNEKFSHLKPQKSNLLTSKSIYIAEKELGSKKTEYKSIKFCFNNGLLLWIGITPQNLDFSQFQKTYPQKFDKEILDGRYSLYSNKNFAIVVENTTNKINNIGIISSQK